MNNETCSAGHERCERNSHVGLTPQGVPYKKCEHWIETPTYSGPGFDGPRHCIHGALLGEECLTWTREDEARKRLVALIPDKQPPPSEQAIKLAEEIIRNRTNNEPTNT